MPNPEYLRRLLNPETARIFRITHVDNVQWILANGLHCSSSGFSDRKYVAIGNPEIIDRRAVRIVPITPGGSRRNRSFDHAESKRAQSEDDHRGPSDLCWTVSPR